MWIFEHNFVADKAKIRRRAVARQVFFTQYATKFAEKTRVYACEDRFLLHKHFRRFRFCPRQALRLPEHHCLLIDQLVAVLELVHVVLDFALQRVADGNRIGVQVVAAEQDAVLVDEEYSIFT